MAEGTCASLPASPSSVQGCRSVLERKIASCAQGGEWGWGRHARGTECMQRFQALHWFSPLQRAGWRGCWSGRLHFGCVRERGRAKVAREGAAGAGSAPEHTALCRHPVRGLCRRWLAVPRSQLPAMLPPTPHTPNKSCLPPPARHRAVAVCAPAERQTRSF